MNEMRDVGPYDNADQVISQWASWSFGLPTNDTQQLAMMLVVESQFLTGVKATRFELDYLASAGMDPIVVTVLHGWLMRAYLAGCNAQRAVKPAPSDADGR